MASQLSQRFNFGEYESLAAPLWVALGALMGFILLAFRCCQHAQEQENKSVVKREGGNGRDPILKNIGELMPAVKSRC